VPLHSGVNPAGILGQMRERGVLLTLSGDNAIRWSPPLVVTTEQLDEGVNVFEQVLIADARVRGSVVKEARG
jgi:acetylornithine/N-succinyldiaminopimelate aminotransferase